jgi:hypothetical protein
VWTLFACDGEGCQPDESEEVGGFFLVPRGDAAESFDGTKEPFDHVPIAIAPAVISLADLADGMRWNAGRSALFVDLIADGVTVIAPVGYDMIRLKALQKTRCLGRVAGLAWGQDEMNRYAAPVDCCVQFGRPATARPSKTTALVGRTFFSAFWRCEPLAA